MNEINVENNLYKFDFIDENSKNIEYEILLSFYSKKFNKVFYVMTDNVVGENNKLNTYAFYKNNIEVDGENEKDNTLYSVIDKEEYDLVFDVFNKVNEEL